MGEQIRINRIEKRYLKHRRRELYTALEEVDFHWDWDEVVKVIEMWKDGVPFAVIAEQFKRDGDESGVLVMDLCRKNRIKPRAGGLGG